VAVLVAAFPAIKPRQSKIVTGASSHGGVLFYFGHAAVPPAEEHNFITAFLSRWGEAVEKTASRWSAR